MATYRHKAFTGKRIYADCTVIAGCEADEPPNAEFMLCAASLLASCKYLWTERGVRYLGWL
jgi:hypothetical protein